MSLPDKFPEGTKFLYHDWLPIAQSPEYALTVYDPDPRPIEWDAIRSEPSVLTEEKFREKVALRKAEKNAKKASAAA